MYGIQPSPFGNSLRSPPDAGPPSTSQAIFGFRGANPRLMGALQVRLRP